MSSYKNNVHLEGNLGKDAEKKSTPNGDVVNFSIAVNEQWEDKDGAEHKNTDWFQIQVWGPLAKFAATLKAGTPVIIEGKIKPETYTADSVETQDLLDQGRLHPQDRLLGTERSRRQQGGQAHQESQVATA